MPIFGIKRKERENMRPEYKEHYQHGLLAFLKVMTRMKRENNHSLDEETTE